MAIQKILVVDDSKTELMFMTDLLQKHGFAVKTAENAEDAFRRLAEEKPDLILMDVVMPGQNGFQLTRAITRDPLYAVACVVTDGTTPVALVGIDELFIGKHTVKQARERIAKSTPIPAANVLIAASHTHSGGPIVSCLGTEGDPAYETALAVAARKFPAKFAYQKNYDARLAHLIEGGMDISLIPSRIEPAGLSAMYNLKYGAIPVARAAGGIHEIIEDYDPTLDRGYGFLCYEYSTEAFWDSIKRAREVFRNRDLWTVLMQRAMAQDFSWEKAAQRYEQVYVELAGVDEQAAA
jgi:CheY-like chemotaxis protein